MNKSEFLDGLREEYRQWEALLDQIGAESIKPSDFFGHFHEEHEADMRAWLERVDTQ